jgi:hypothetical protein
VDVTEAEGPGNAPVSPARKLAGRGRRWSQDLDRFQRTRLERVQASARVWLGVLTTLLGLLGSVVLLKGGDLVTGVTDSGLFQGVLVVVVGLVFAVTVLAVIFGGQATWGGLADIPGPPDDDKAGPPPARRISSGHRQWWLRAWFRFAAALALNPDRARSGHRESDETSARPPVPAWQVYRDRSLASADRRRIYLHASRAAGVIAAGLIALLAILAVIAGTVSPAPAQVIVIHHGRVGCGPVSRSMTYTGVTQVIPVTHC